MTRREWVEKNMPHELNANKLGGVDGCPYDNKYASMPGYLNESEWNCGTVSCYQCWGAELPSEEPVSDAAPDNVNHPAHYELPGGIECFDVLLATQGLDAVKNFCICNAMKYLFRRNRKNGDEDVKKAAWYIAKYIELSKEVGANG